MSNDQWKESGSKNSNRPRNSNQPQDQRNQQNPRNSQRPSQQQQAEQNQRQSQRPQSQQQEQDQRPQQHQRQSQRPSQQQSEEDQRPQYQQQQQQNQRQSQRPQSQQQEYDQRSQQNPRNSQRPSQQQQPEQNQRQSQRPQSQQQDQRPQQHQRQSQRPSQQQSEEDQRTQYQQQNRPSQDRQSNSSSQTQQQQKQSTVTRHESFINQNRNSDANQDRRNAWGNNSRSSSFYKNQKPSSESNYELSTASNIETERPAHKVSSIISEDSLPRSLSGLQLRESTESKEQLFERKSETPRESVSNLITYSDEFKDFPKKPKERCTLGGEIIVAANHYAFFLKNPIYLFQYDVALTSTYIDKKSNQKKEKELKSKDIAKELFLEFVEIYPNLKNKTFFDNRKLMFSMLALPVNTANEVLTVNIENKDAKDKGYIMRIKKTSEITINPNELIDPAALQALQLMFTHNLNHRFVPVMRSYFRHDFDRVNLGFNIDLWKGFYVSVRPSEAGLNLNIDVANTVIFEDANVIDLACSYYGCKADDLAKVGDNFKDFMYELKGKRVKTYLNYTKKVEGLGPIASKYVIKVKDQNITIEQYFSQQGRRLKFPNLPCLDLGKANYTPMELCRTELKSQKKITPKQTSQIIRETAVPAFKRKQDIETMIQKSELSVDPILANYNINLQFRMVEMKGRVLAAPDLEYGNRTRVTSAAIGRKGQWDNLNKEFCDTRHLKNWIVVVFSKKINDETIDNLVQSFMNVGASHGIRVEVPRDYIYGDPFGNESKTLNFLNKEIRNVGNLQLILAIISGSAPIYNAIKTYGDVLNGLPTQVIDDSTIGRQKGKYDRLVSNICMKINVKLGGKNFQIYQGNSLFQTYLQQLYNGPLMIFGADVIHPSPVDKDTCESIAAVVGSIDKECCYYAARLGAQQQPKAQSYETIHDLGLMVFELLNEYFKANGNFPKRIVFLRDGVSEGQFKDVRAYEMNQIRKACQKVDTSYKPGVTFVVVQKRHHTRFFPTNRNDESGKAANVPPGTLVDCKIITPDKFDFFLCSHMGIQGTSKPCHYFILHDENQFTMNQIALLCHYLCHIYSRSTTSVSYPAPTYYADLCAERGRAYIRDRINSSHTRIVSQPIHVHEKFKNKMFFI